MMESTQTRHFLRSFTIISVFAIVVAKRELIKDLNKCEQCFGFGGGTRLETPELHEQITAEEFFKEYVYPTQKPVVMRGLMKDTDAYRNWQTDEYLMSLDVPPGSKQRVEITKIQDSSKPILNMNFHDFVEIYHDLPYYMVDTLPTFMRQDVTVPLCLQCDAVRDEILADQVLWFSSGGTNGYVHTDQVDNLHCVFSGNKYFIIVHPKYLEKIKFDKPVSTSSFIDVNHVGYETRPELLEVEYYHANISEGDCVFLPFEWIHQVRSYGERHIAVSIWWDYYNNTKVDFNKCNKELDPNMKLSHLELHPDDHNFHVGTIKDGIIRCVNKAVEEGAEGMNFVRYATLGFSELGRDLSDVAALIQKALPLLKKTFAACDLNGDGLVTQEENRKMADEDWMTVRDRWIEMQRFIDASMKDYIVTDEEWWNANKEDQRTDQINEPKPIPNVNSPKDEF